MSEYKGISERIDVSRLRWLERRMLEHTDPVNFLLHILGLIIIVYGLWINVLGWVIIGIIFPILGHIYVWSIQAKIARKKQKKRKNEQESST